MTADVEASGADRPRRWRVTLQSLGAGEDGGGEPAFLEQPQEPPKADAGAIFEHRFGGQITAVGTGFERWRFGESGFTSAIAVR